MKTWTLLLAGAALLAGTGSAAAAVASDELGADFLGADFLGADFLDGCGDAGISGVADVTHSVNAAQTRNQNVNLVLNDVIQGLALHNAGVDDVSFDTLRNVQSTTRQFVTEARLANVAQNEVVGALVLGIQGSGGSLDALACVTDVTQTATQTATLNRFVDLDEVDTAGAIAIANTIGGDISLDEVADISETRAVSASAARNVSVPLAEALRVLALGAAA